MEDLFMEMTATLSEAQDTMEEELEELLGVQSAGANTARLVDLRRSAVELSKQAGSLLAMMLERDAPESMTQFVASLVSFFDETEERITSVLKAGQDRG